jgi:hypothetical protein
VSLPRPCSRHSITCRIVTAATEMLAAGRGRPLTQSCACRCKRAIQQLAAHPSLFMSGLCLAAAGLTLIMDRFTIIHHYILTTGYRCPAQRDARRTNVMFTYSGGRRLVLALHACAHTGTTATGWCAWCCWTAGGGGGWCLPTWRPAGRSGTRCRYSIYASNSHNDTPPPSIAMAIGCMQCAVALPFCITVVYLFGLRASLSAPPSECSN